MLKKLVIIISLTVLTGCTGVFGRVFSKPNCSGFLCSSDVYYPYNGVAADLDFISFCLLDVSGECYGTTDETLFMVPFGLIDLPFTLVLDTVLLPLDIYNVIKY